MTHLTDQIENPLNPHDFRFGFISELNLFWKNLDILSKNNQAEGQ